MPPEPSSPSSAKRRDEFRQQAGNAETANRKAGALRK
jgi:hypothetical protein